MLKIMVVEKLDSQRADFVDAVCEIPDVVACSAAGFMDALRILSTESMDALVVGALPDTDQRQLTTLMKHLRCCEVIAVAGTSDLIGRIEALAVEHRRKPDRAYDSSKSRAGMLALARAGKVALVHRLRTAQRSQTTSTPREMQTVVLKDWLPAMCAGFQSMMPAHVELVPVISGDTPPVRCVPDVLEHEMFDIVLDAAAKLPWGGTIWLTAEPTSNDTVRIDVLENGLGTGGDVTLRTAAAAAS